MIEPFDAENLRVASDRFLVRYCHCARLRFRFLAQSVSLADQATRQMSLK
jgi:hypothetical protein